MSETSIPCPSLAVYRRASGRSQASMADAIGRSRRQYQRDEQALSAPLTVIEACAGVLGVATVDLRSPAHRGPDRELVSLAQRHERACDRVRAKAGNRAYTEARTRVVAARPEWVQILPDFTGTEA